MCGIVGYIGSKNAKEILIKGLKNLEYRGYDSSGIAVLIKDKIEITKQKGRIKDLEKILTKTNGNLGIGHTRWATHGEPTKENAHPHNVGNITLVHNGIIENYQNLKKTLKDKGYNFNSDTDSEIACALIDSIYKEKHNKLETLKEANKILKGSFAFGIIFKDDPENIYAMRKDSPLIIAKGKNENFISSDVPAILEFTNEYILLEKDEYAVIGKDKIKIFNQDLREITKEEKIYEGEANAISKNGFEHYMLKEINEEPEALQKTYTSFFKETISELLETMPDFSKYKKIEIVACGSAYYAGLVGKSILEKYADIETNAYLASEYRYEKIFNDKETLTILISQSGETADTLAALRKAKEKGLNTLGIINTVSSSIAREAKSVLYIKVGPEISVATTKAYQAQVLVLSLIALAIAQTKKLLTSSEELQLTKSIKNLPQELKEELKMSLNCSKIADLIKESEHIFFLGRGIDYYLCLEGCLKLKEISYIHSESYPAGELKHGTISLITKETPVIAIITDQNIKDKTISNIKEVKSRGAKVILITTTKILKENQTDNFYDEVITVEETNKLTTPIKVIALFQLIAYETANKLGREIDKPRNLAKSVTVE